jgi:hypothetical protein
MQLRKEEIVARNILRLQGELRQASISNLENA